MIEILNLFVNFSNNFLEINIIDNVIQIYHILYFLILIGGIHSIIKILKGD